MAITLTDVIRIPEQVAVLDRGEYVLALNLARRGQSSPLVFRDSALTIWKSITGMETVESVVENVCSVTGAARSTIAPSVVALIKDLVNLDLVEAVASE